MKKLLGLLIITSALLWSCGSNEGSSNGSEKKEAKGGKVYGGSLKISQSESLTSIYPPSIVDAYTANIASSVFEGLVKFSAKDLSIQPSIAESWTIDKTGTIYTFNLKKGIKFHDDPCFKGSKGRELKASDVLYSFSLICSDGDQNRMFSSTLKGRLVGADKYFEASEKGKPNFALEGVKIIDDYTVSLTLTQPFSSFLYILAYPSLSIIAQEAIEKYGNKITNGTGAFIIPADQKINTESQLVLVRNNDYHVSDTLGNQLPLLDSIEIAIIDSKKAELDEFNNGNLHVVNGLPAESIREIVEQQIANFQNKPPKFILDRSPQMGTEYYELNLNSPALKDKRVRQAINHAIDRNGIIDKVLKGEAYGPAENGITPPTFRDYDINNIKGYNYDVEKARLLLAEAGYPGGRGFSTLKLELNSGGYKNTSVAFEIQKQLMDNLGINIDLEVVSFNQKIEDERYGKADIFRTAWIADYPSPDNFLFLFYGVNVPSDPTMPSYPNVTRFKNDQFDELYEKALTSNNTKEANEYLLQAESIMMDEAPIIPLWYNERYRLIKSDVRSYYTNAMNYRDFSEVYLKNIGKVSYKGQ
jgi:oligopeptide transport system substrate-binding protein